MQIDECWAWKCFHEDVSNIVFGINVVKFEMIKVDAFVDVVVSCVDMLDTCME